MVKLLKYVGPKVFIIIEPVLLLRKLLLLLISSATGWRRNRVKSRDCVRWNGEMSKDLKKTAKGRIPMSQTRINQMLMRKIIFMPKG